MLEVNGKRADAGNEFALFVGSTLRPEAEEPELTLCLNCKVALTFRSVCGLFGGKPIQMPKQRLLRKSRDLHLGKELTSRITRFQPVLHTRKEPMVVYIVGGVLGVGDCCSCYMEGKDESAHCIRPLN